MHITVAIHTTSLCGVGALRTVSAAIMQQIGDGVPHKYLQPCFCEIAFPLLQFLGTMEPLRRAYCTYHIESTVANPRL